jgi:hypothetical protein
MANRTGLAEVIGDVEASFLRGAQAFGQALYHHPCAVLGHDYGPAVYVSPSVLHCCSRCGRDIQGRTLADLAPMTEEDREQIERELEAHS